VHPQGSARGRNREQPGVTENAASVLDLLEHLLARAVILGKNCLFEAKDGMVRLKKLGG